MADSPDPLLVVAAILLAARVVSLLRDAARRLSGRTRLRRRPIIGLAEVLDRSIAMYLFRSLAGDGRAAARDRASASVGRLPGQSGPEPMRPARMVVAGSDGGPTSLPRRRLPRPRSVQAMAALLAVPLLAIAAVAILSNRTPAGQVLGATGFPAMVTREPASPEPPSASPTSRSALAPSPLPSAGP